MKLPRKILKKSWIKPLFLVLFFFVFISFLFYIKTEQTSAYDVPGIEGTYSGGPSSNSDPATVAAIDAAKPSCSIWSPLSCFLTLVLGFVSFLLQASATLFAWIVAPENQTAVMGQPIIYQSWTMVRDILNVAFILVLLFSAFATIFRVEKYSYKKLLLNLILMALLVNFSFPIARFIIDTSNVLMYSLINRMTFDVNGTAGTAKDTMGALAFGSQFSKMLDPKNSDTTYLLSAIVFGFILAITLLAIAVMFVIRMVALAILIIFSPIAFVASILPDTSSYSSKWWSHLFKYAFFGPIMIFMLYISSALIIQMGSIETIKQFQQKAVNQTSTTDAGIIAAISFYSIPIVVLWFGMGMAQSMGIAGAATVMGAAQKVSKGAGKKFSGYNAVSKRYGAYKAERKKRADEKFKDNWGSKIGEWANRTQDSLMPGSEKARKRLAKMHKDKNKDDIDKGAKDLVDSGANAGILAQQMNDHFGSFDPANPPSKKEKVDQAKAAAAYLRQDADERKIHIQNTLRNAGGVGRSEIENIMNAPPPAGMTGSALAAYTDNQREAHRSAAAIAGAARAGTPISENDMRQVEAFIKNQMKRTVESGANAT